MSGYSIVTRDEAPDFMAQYPGFGEMRFFAEPAGGRAGRVHLALDAGGHRRQGLVRPPAQTVEEIYFVMSGKLISSSATTSSRSGRDTVVRVAPEIYRWSTTTAPTRPSS